MNAIWDRIPLIVDDFCKQYRKLPWEEVSGRTFISKKAIPYIKDTKTRIQFERDLIEMAKKVLPASDKYYWFIRETSTPNLYTIPRKITYTLVFAPFYKTQVYKL